MKNARFWHWTNSAADGWVKITLRPGQTLRWSEYHRTDEGHSFQTYTWTHDGEQITREWSNGGRDCDGRISTTGSDVCPIDKLDSLLAYPDDVPWLHDGRMINRPDWQAAEPTTVNDQFAQLSNY